MKASYVVSLVVVVAMLTCAGATAGPPKTLSPAVGELLRDKTSALIVHEPPDINFYGMDFLGDREDFGALKAALGDDLIVGTRDRGGGLLSDMTGTTDGFHLRGSSVTDPALKVARQVQLALETKYGVRPLDQPPTRLPAIPVTQGPVAKTDVDSILAKDVAGDLVVNVRTTYWQIHRPNALTDLWFLYGARVTIIDVRSRTILFETDCGVIDRHAWAKKPFLQGFLGGGRAPLEASIEKTSDSCLAIVLARAFRK